MYKQRDNEFYPPMMSDPSGTGAVSSALTAHTAVHSNNTNNSSSYGNHNDGGAMGNYAAPAVAAGSRKRSRDIRGIERFRSVVYGEDGFRRLHAMVTRNPTLMYPPEGVDEARARVAEHQRDEQQQQQQVQEQQREGRDGALLGAAETAEDDVFALFEERRAIEQQHKQQQSHNQQHFGSTNESAAPNSPVAAPPEVTASAAALRRDEELAKNHHKQLDSFLRLLYEFNHVSFVKLPMEDTLSLLSRCGKEAVAHVVEYETQLRLARQARLKELIELQEEKTALAKRRRAAEAAEEARVLAAAEQRQAELERHGVADNDPSSDEAVRRLEEELFNRNGAAPHNVPQVHFALEEKVKEEEDVKDTDLVETVVTADVQLPLVRDAVHDHGVQHDKEELLLGNDTEDVAV